MKLTNLRSHIGYRLRLVSNAVSQSFANKLSCNNVTVAEWVVLREMYYIEEEISPSIVADLTDLTRGTISKLVNRLFLKSLITRSESTKDRRFQKIKLTEKAKELVPKLANIADENDQSFFSILTNSEKNNLMDILIKISEFHNISTTPIK